MPSLEERFNEVASLEDRFNSIAGDSLNERFNKVASLEDRFNKVSGETGTWENPGIDLLTGEPIPEGKADFKLNPQIVEKSKTDQDKWQEARFIVDPQKRSEIVKYIEQNIKWKDNIVPEWFKELSYDKKIQHGMNEKFEAPPIDPIVDLAGGAAFGAKMGAKAGLKGASLFKNVVKEGVSNVTMGASDIAGATGKGIFKRLSHAEEVKDFKTFLKDVVQQPSESIKIEKPVEEITEPIVKNVAEEIPEKAGNINLNKMDITVDAKKLAKDLFDKEHGTITWKEIKEASTEADLITKIMSDKEQAEKLGAIFKTREHTAGVLEDVFKNNKLTKEAFEELKTLSPQVSFAGRLLNSLKIQANPVLDDARSRILDKLAKLGMNTDEVIKAAEGLDWNNAKQVTDFYRQFVKPTWGEILKEFRYINMLSSIKTHVINTTSNLSQALIVRPMDKAMEAGIDVFKKVLTGKDREHFFKEIPAYYRGVITSSGESMNQALKVMAGKSNIFRPDINYIPTNAKGLKPFQMIPKALEASDVFFRNMITQAEAQALIKRGMSKSEAIEKASKKAEELVFRKKIDPNNKLGQGTILSHIDKLTNIAYTARRVKPVDWFIPFVETPMNIFKQGLEHSPLGVTTLIGSVNKTEQLAKTLTGSLVFGASAYKAFKGDVTWAAPTSEQDKKIWEAAGLQPYSIKIGENWVSLSRLGVLAYPFAMAAALKYNLKDSPKYLVDSTSAKTIKTLAGIGKFFSDQSYVDGIGNIVNLAEGDEQAATKIISQLGKQVIPLSSLQQWVAQIVDPIKRKSSSEFSVEGIIQNLKKTTPFLSKDTEPYIDFQMQPVRNTYKWFNALSPVTATKENPEMKRLYDVKTGVINKQKAPIDKIKKDVNKNMFINMFNE